LGSDRFLSCPVVASTVWYDGPDGTRRHRRFRCGLLALAFVARMRAEGRRPRVHTRPRGGRAK
jgi:hypothetical protein